jgi:hypothetical protein
VADEASELPVEAMLLTAVVDAEPFSLTEDAGAEEPASVVGSDAKDADADVLGCELPTTDVTLEVSGDGMLIEGRDGNVITGGALVEDGGDGAAVGAVLGARLNVSGLFVEVGGCSVAEMGCSDVCVFPGACEVVKTGGCVLNSGGALLVTTGCAAKALQ